MDSVDCADDDLDVIVRRVRAEIAATGEDRASSVGEYVTDMSPEVADVVMALVRVGTYRAAAERVGVLDPDLADQ